MTAPQTPPTLTVIICNYNHGEFLPRALEAIASQSRPPDQFVIVDDGSTDNSVAIIEGFAQKIPCLQLVRHEKNQGLMAAIARALAMATGDYVYWGASDDFVLPGFFEKALQLARRFPHAGSIVGTCQIASPDGRDLGLLTGPGWADGTYVAPDQFLRDYLQKTPPSHSFVSAVIYRRANLLAVGGFRARLGFWVDTFAFRAVGLRFGIAFTDHRCACWHTMPGSVSMSTLLDPKKELRVLAELEAVMRSEEFRDLFPSDYVSAWSAAYREEIVGKAVARLDSSFTGLGALLWLNLDRRSLFERGAKWALVRCDRWYRTFLKFFLRHSLMRYRPETARQLP